MVQRNLGLFDTPADRRHITVCLLIIGVLAGFTCLIFPVRNVSPGEVPEVVLVSDVTMLLVDLLTATMLLNQSFLFRSRALMFLGCGLIYGALLNIPHALTFPGLFSDEGLLGAGVNTTAWIASAERMSFPVAILAYALVRRAEKGEALSDSSPAQPPPIAAWVALTIILALLTTFLTTAGHASLPSFFRDRTELANASQMGLGIVSYVLMLAAVVVLVSARKSMLDIWLLVALFGQVIQGALVTSLHARFTVGWYGLFALSVGSRLSLTVALLIEAIRHYTSLAAATATRDRDRDLRIMSMDAVAGAMAHEVGQPLSAAMLQMTTAQKWLKGKPAQSEKANASLTAAMESTNEAFEVIKSTRALFDGGPGVTTECDINELVRRAASLLDIEMTARKIALQLNLGEDIPPFVANRVQFQRVLVNLLTNAMEAFDERRGERQIIARTGMNEHGRIEVEISDNGRGITDGDEERIFDPFFTTKRDGTGLGLSLCRAIVKDHQGHLFTEAKSDQGATFRLDLPPSKL